MALKILKAIEEIVDNLVISIFSILNMSWLNLVITWCKDFKSNSKYLNNSAFKFQELEINPSYSSCVIPLNNEILGVIPI